MATTINATLDNIAIPSGSTVGTIATAAKGILCLPSLLQPGLVNIIKLAIKSFKNIAKEFANKIISMVVGVINSAIAKIIGALTSLIRRIAAIINSIIDAIFSLKALIERLKSIINSYLDCNFNAANVFRCLSSKVADNLTNRVATKLASSAAAIDNKATEIANEISSPNNTINRYLNSAEIAAQRANVTLAALNEI